VTAPDTAGSALPSAGTETSGPPTGLGVAAGVVFVAIAAIAGWSLWTDPNLPLGESDSDPGPAFVPWIAVWILGLGGAVQVLITLVQARRAGGLRAAEEFTLQRVLLPVALIVSLLVYVLVTLRPLGFVLSSTLFAVVWVALFHWRSGDPLTPRHALLLPIEAVLIVGAIYIVFRHAILIPLP
jgi:hypothetical protein